MQGGAADGGRKRLPRLVNLKLSNEQAFSHCVHNVEQGEIHFERRLS
jgi:hypothetical protein